MSSYRNADPDKRAEYVRVHNLASYSGSIDWLLLKALVLARTSKARFTWLALPLRPTD